MPTQQLREQLLSWLDSRSAQPGETALVSWFVLRVTREADGHNGIETLDFKDMASFTTDLTRLAEIHAMQMHALQEHAVEAVQPRRGDHTLAQGAALGETANHVGSPTDYHVPAGLPNHLFSLPRPAAAKRRLGLGYRISAPAGLKTASQNIFDFFRFWDLFVAPGFLNNWIFVQSQPLFPQETVRHDQAYLSPPNPLESRLQVESRTG